MPIENQLTGNGGHIFASQSPMLNPVRTNNSIQDRQDEAQQRKPASSALDDLADLEDLMEGGEMHGSVQKYLQEAFCLVFKDEFTQFSSAMQHAFNNSVQSTIETRKFL
mmetsp:Transcript_21730/g.26781  ORF Transcript_21730/g.26781 Transcript_21730/m.26781 type:complete len:109 (+) Transcript_21730:3549-3875(+)|eukprot:CAMPEP_0170455314 /NCGR_PEP_ID=MMETSP0123-20130129/3323_1 /TAXON_ID=182087 /ORGANISM="Favella ehrenbergii, Strain Fehren 1" /LENGTH=108 /DNA_ID=CAMNT_0010718417 /DNA_START=3477 /DNA_END=3803 /DNA_ORIENTATION=+